MHDKMLLLNIEHLYLHKNPHPHFPKILFHMATSDNSKKGLIIAFYLSKFDKIAYNRLGFKTQSETHKYIGEILGIKPTTIKNWREEFDPYEDNSRAGWHQRPVRKRLLEIKSLFDHIEEPSFYEIVKNLIEKNNNSNIEDIISIIKTSEDDSQIPNSHTYSIQMAQTGKMAEEYFENHYIGIFSDIFSTNKKNIQLTDTRLSGCGYDYEISIANKTFHVEIKGMYDDNSSNIRFTDKEWAVANEKQDNYILVVVKNLSSTPYHIAIINPAKNLSPEMQIQQVIQISWIANIPDIRVFQHQIHQHEP